MSRLSLGKKRIGEMAESNDTDMPPGNQEAMHYDRRDDNDDDYDDDKFDLTMKLSDIEEQDAFEEKSVSAFGKITKILNERQELAKRRESLSYGMRSGYLPKWITYKITCNLHLENEEDDKDFRNRFDPFAKCSLSGIVKNVIQFLDAMILNKEENINKIRTETFKSFGVATERSAMAKESFDEHLHALHERNTTEIQDFRDGLRQNAMSNYNNEKKEEKEHHPPRYQNPRGRGYSSRRFRRGRAGRGRPY